MSSDGVSEERERDLVAKVELRLALADNAAKFEQGLDTFVAPLLLKLASSHASVRQAVFNVLKDILARLNSLRVVKVPVQKLLLQAQSPSILPNQDDGPVRLYSLLLASKGVDRMDPSEARMMVPLAMRTISGLPRRAAARMFQVLCKLLLKWVPPLKGSQEEDEVREFLALEDEKDLEFLLHKFTQFFLLIPAKADPQSGTIPRGYSCPGLCADDVSFFTYEAGVSFTKEQMLRFKAAIYKFVTNGLVQDDQLLLKFLSVASTDSSNLSDSAIQHLKRLNTPYEDANFINFMISLYTGDNVTGAPPVKHELQERILGTLNKSVVATTNSTQVSRICSIGMHSQHRKLGSLSLIFIRHVAKYNYQSLLDHQEGAMGIAPLIRNKLHEEGWPRLQLGSATPNLAATLDLRRLQYETLGDILRKDATLLLDLSYIEFLLDSLKGDLSEFRPSIQEALISLTATLPTISEESKISLKMLIRKNMADDYQIDLAENKEAKEAEMSCRYVCIKFCNAVFPFDDADARMINVWGTSRNNKFDVIEEAYKGLHPYWFRVNQALNTTEFKKTSDLLASEIRETSLPRFETFARLVLKEVEIAATIPSSSISKTLNVAIRFCKQCLISEAVRGVKTVVIQDEDWSVRIEKALEVDDLVRKKVFDLLFTIDHEWLTMFLRLLTCEFIIKDEKGTQVSSFQYHDPIFGETLLSLLRYCNSNILRSLEVTISQIYSHIESMAINSVESLKLSANILGIIAANAPDSENVKAIIGTIESTPDFEVSPSLLANSYIIPRMLIKRVPEAAAKLEILAGKLTSLMQSPRKNDVTIDLLGQISKFGSLSHLNNEAKDQFVLNAVEFLNARLLNNSAAAEVWGYLSIYANHDQFMTRLNKIWETHVSKQVDFLFSVGEALSVMAAGWHSIFLWQQLDILNDSPTELQEIYDEEKLRVVVDKVLESCDSTKPSLRRASCIWLLSLVQFLKNNEKLSERSSEIHLRFMKFLADRDELIQESAARGLSLTYEIGDENLKESMIKGLLKSFTDTKSTNNMTAGSVAGETELFDADVLKTNDGSIRTYQDILNLSSEVGDPSLVYKFMSLSRSSLLWSSKKGIAFGLGAIMSKSSLQNLLLENQDTANKLIPKLFRYKFDPYPAVARSMSDIWNSLIVDSPSVISDYFDSILQELLTGMGNKEWRVREASTLALLQLVQSQPREKFADSVLSIWTMAFRAMDDIKESVRDASMKLTTGLSKILARSINVNEGINPEAAKKILNQILPFFLGVKGINSDAEEVRNYAMKMLLELIKNSGDATKPFAIELVYDFILLFSAIEPQAINFLSLNASNYKIDANAIDLHRRNSIGNSPLMEAVNKLIDISDDSMMDGHVSSAVKAAKNSVGLPSNVAASAVLILLVKKYQMSLKPLSGKLLKSCVNAFGDRNQSVRLAFAVSFGHIFHISSLDKTVKYSKQLTESYFSGDIETKLVVGTAIESTLKHASVEFENVASLFMPLLFIASNDSEKTISSYFDRLWTEVSTSGSGAVKLYLEEILRALKEHINSNDFSVRRTCGKSISVLCDRVDHSVSEKLIDSLFLITLKSLSGRSWEGKEVILEALQSLSSKFTKHVNNNDELRSRLGQAFEGEISRNNESYVSKAIFPYYGFFAAFPQSESTEKLIDVTRRLLHGGDQTNVDAANEQEVGNTRIKADSEISRKSSRKNIEKEDFAIKALKACANVCKSVEANKEQQIILVKFTLDETAKLFDHLSILYTWRSQVAACEIGQLVVNSLNVNLDKEMEELLMKFWSRIIKCNGTKESIENVKIQTIKLAASLRKYAPGLKLQIESDLRVIAELDPTSRVENELRNIGL